MLRGARKGSGLLAGALLASACLRAEALTKPATQPQAKSRSSAPVPTRLRKVDGHWNVSADPFIAGRKAADAARKNAAAKNVAHKAPAPKN
jgi:hypothetical protein